MTRSIEVGLLGATGTVGQQFVSLLDRHPWLELTWIAARDRPQPRLDVDAHGGMVVHAGRLRPCPVLGWKVAALGHNTIRGAAGAAILNAELLVAGGIAHGQPAAAGVVRA